MMRALLGLSILLLGGCATPYQPRAETAGGYDDLRLSDQIFQVSFRANGYTSEERIRDLTLLRSAEVTLEQGFRYFALIDHEEYLRYGRLVAPQVPNEAARRSSGISWRGQTYALSPQTRTHTIACFHEKPQLWAYDAPVVRATLRAKYEMGPKDPAALTAAVGDSRQSESE